MAVRHNMSISEHLDPRDARYVQFVARRAEGVSEEGIASALGFDSPEDLYRQLAWDRFPVCAWCGSGFVAEEHCEPAREHRRRETRALYSGGLQRWPIFSLAPRWLQELARVRLMPELRRQAGRLGGPPEEDARPVPLESGEIIYIRPAAIVDEKGYERAEVLDQLLRTDVAILADLAVLEGGEGPTTKKGDPDKEILYAVYDARKAAKDEKTPKRAEAMVRSCWEQLVNVTEAKLRRDRKTSFEKLESDKERRRLAEQTAKASLRESERPLELAEAEVRFYHEHFEKLSERERRTLVVEDAERIHKVAKAAREHAEYLERGQVGKGATKTWVSVRAAEMADIEGLSDQEIGKKLGIGQSRSEKAGERRDVSNVRRAKTEGRRLLDILHDGRWAQYAAEQARRSGLR